MLQVFRAAILKTSDVFPYIFLSCNFEAFGSKTSRLLLIGWKQDLRMTLIREFHWVVTLKTKARIILFICRYLRLLAFAIKIDWRGLGIAISLLLEFGMHWIISLRRHQVWQLWTFTKTCRSDWFLPQNLTGKLWEMPIFVTQLWNPVAIRKTEIQYQVFQQLYLAL